MSKQQVGPKYAVTVQLTGHDGNAFAIIATVSRALKRAEAGNDEIAQFQLEARSGDYDDLLQTCMKWVDVQ